MTPGIGLGPNSVLGFGCQASDDTGDWLKATECVGAKGRFGGPRAKLVPNLGTVTPKRYG